jgi:TM2 domain-containing membrane protein YozV
VGVTQVSWTNDRGGSGVATGTTAWSVSGIALQSGDNVLTVTARDAAGNVASDVLTVTYTPPDVTAPTIGITTPTANPTLSVTTTPLTVGGTAGDNVGVTQVSWTNDRGGSGTATGTTAWSVVNVALLAGDNVLTVTARDAAGNVATDILTITYQPAPPPSGLVAAWGFNEGTGTTVADVSGNNNTGTITGATWSTQGRFGGALTFNGTSNVVVVNSAPSLNLTAAMTVSAWVYPTASQSGWRTIVQRQVDAYFLHASNSAGALRPAGGGTFNGTNTYVGGPSAIAVNTWTHLAVTYDGATIRLFVNGTQVATTPQTGSIETNTNPLRIGGNTYGEYFQGRIDDVRIYSRALTATDIQSDMAVSVGGGAPPDATAPSVAITTPTANPTLTVTTTPLALGGTASDNVGVTQVSWTNDRGGSGVATGTTAWSVSGIALQSGDNILTVTARDAAGNVASDVLTVTYAPGDPTPPTVAITTPTANPTFTATTATLTLGGSASDNVGVTQVSWTNDRGGSGVATGTTAWSVSGIALQSGDNVLTVTARDAAGNVATDVLTVTYAAVGPSSGLVAAWGFNEGAGTTVADASGNGNTGTISGAAWSIQGRYGSALSFNGTNSVVVINSAPSLNLTTGMTLSAWVYPTANESGWRTIMQREVNAYYLHASSGSGVLFPAAGGTFGSVDNSLVAPYAIPVSTWSHLAVTYDGAALRLFVNGAQVNSVLQTAPIETNTKPLRIGGNSPYGEYFQGLIDEVRIYNRALTAAEIQSDMAVSTTAPRLVIVQPAAGGFVSGTTVAVAYTTTGDLTEVNHVHFQLDANPEVMDLSFDGAYQFTNVLVGAHVLRGYLVRADHSKIPNTDASVSFTTGAADSTPPTVAITAPASGATLTGTLNITASASDNGAVAGVQFYLDGAPLGSEISTAPYSIPWNTATATNASHSLTARARDVAGNATLSAAVPVTVANNTSTDPAVVGQWSAVLDWPLVAIHMNLLPDGKVLVWDDHTDGTGVGVFDPATLTVTTAPFTAANLFCAGHSLLPDGRVFVAGGHIDPHIGITAATIFNPQTRKWSSAAQMSLARWYPTVTTLANGRMLVVGGEVDCGDCNAQVPEVFDPATGTWTRLANAPFDLPYYPHDFVLPDGRVLVTGANKRELATYALDVAAQTWTTIDPTVLDAGSSVMYLPGKVMKSGRGRDPDLPGAPSVATTYVLDMTAPTPHWRQTAPMAYPRTEHNLTLLPDGTVLTIGGGVNSDVYDPNAPVLQPELWNPGTEIWTLLAPMDRPRIYHSTAVLLPDGRVLSAGGGRYGPSYLDAQLYSPPYLFKGPRPTITTAPATLGYGANFAIATPDAAAISAVTLVGLGSVTHAFNANQRFLALTFQAGAGSLSVQGPSGATLAPPGHYMLFIINANGIPSVASIVQIQ